MSSHSSTTSQTPREWVDPLTALLSDDQFESNQADATLMNADDLSTNRDVKNNEQFPVNANDIHRKNDTSGSFSNLSVQEEEVSHFTTVDQTVKRVSGNENELDSSSSEADVVQDSSLLLTSSGNSCTASNEFISNNENESFDILQHTLDYVGMLPGERLIMHLNKVYHITEGCNDRWVIFLNISLYK